MIAALMLYSLATSILVGAAAIAAERVLRLAQRPARVIWIAAILTALGISAARFVSALTAPTPSSALGVAPAALAGGDNDQVLAATPFTPVIGESSRTRPSVVRAMLARLNAARILVTSDSMVTRLDTPLLIAWFALSMVGLIVIGYSVFELARPHRRWPTTTVDGVPVLLSHDVGPAVIGLFHYRIVLPAWALTLPAAQRDLVLVHEREHAAAADPVLLFAATVVVALSPWNVALWWMALRLRFAIELDCDTRVLRQRPDHQAYGALLLDVTERTFGGAMPIVALAEPVSLVERRIAAMVSQAPRFARLRSVVAGFCVVVLVAGACVAPRPASVSAHRNASSRAIRSDATPSNIDARTDEARAQALRLASTPVPNVVAPVPSRRLMAPPVAARIGTIPVPLKRVTVGTSDAVDEAFRLIYDGIALMPDQEGQAREILKRIFVAALAQDLAVTAASLKTLPQRQALRAERDSTLRALLTNDADRATLDARLAALPDGGMRGRSGGPGPDGPRGRVGGAGGGQRVGGAGGGQRVGGDGRGGRVGGDGIERRVSVTTTTIGVQPTVPTGGPGAILADMVETIFHRLFDGIALTPDQETSARATLTETQLALRALVQPAPDRLPIMSESELALVALVTNDADRKTVQARISALDQAAPFQR